MSTIQRSVFVSPCYAIEDLPKDGGPEQAADFLNAWIAGWDPRLIAGLNVLPEWKRNDSGSLDLENTLLIIPEMSRHKVDIPQRERLQLGRCLVVDSDSRDLETLALAIRDTLSKEGVSVPANKPLHLDDFHALGYMVLQIQILARKLRYSWNLDWLAFSEQVISAAKASVELNEEDAERWLQAAFDSLSQERDRYCAQQIHLLDVVLLASTTLGSTLATQLDCPHPQSYLANASILTELQKSSPENWQRFLELERNHTVSIIGGLSQPIAMNYATFRGLNEAFSAGRNVYESLGVRAPVVFSQFEPGMAAILPDVLLSQGFKGTLLNAWSGGRVPTKDSAKVRWQAQTEATPIDCIIDHVADASTPETILHFASHVAKQLDYHHVPTLVLAHWPAATAQHMKLLVTAMKRSPALGVFETVEKYFSSTNQPYGSETFVFRQFSSPLPAGDREIVLVHSLRTEILRLQTRTERLLSTATLWKQVFPNKIPEEILQSIKELDSSSQQLSNCSVALDATDVQARLQNLSQRTEELTRELQTCLVEANGLSPSASTTNGYLFVNTSSHPRRVFVPDLPGNIDPNSSKRILSSQYYKGRSSVVVDLPPSGFVKVKATNVSSASTTQISPPIMREGLWGKMTGSRSLIADSDWTLSNEFMEVQIDPKKGHLRSVFVPSKRGSRISGMPSIVLGPPNASRKWKESDFLVPIKTSLKLIEGSKIRGTIQVQHDFQLPSGKSVPLVVRYSLWKGARWINVEIEAPRIEGEDYHCIWRTAWANESALINSWQQGSKGKLPAPLQGVVELIEIDDAENRTYLATYGNSIHHKWDHRYLVTQLTELSDRSTKSKLAIGMDWTRPLETARDLFDPPFYAGIHGTDATLDEGAWLAQSNIPNISMLFESHGPLELAGDETSPPESADATLWLHETRGRRAVSKLSFFKPVEEAWRINSQNHQWTKLDVEDGLVFANLRPSEQCRIAIKWSRNA